MDGASKRGMTRSNSLAIGLENMPEMGFAKDGEIKNYFFEVATEIPKKSGGINTVIRTKAQSTVEDLGKAYCLVGVYNKADCDVEVEMIDPSLFNVNLAVAIEQIRKHGVEIHFGKWLIGGAPAMVLFNLGTAFHKIDEWKNELWEKGHIGIPIHDQEANNAVVFGFLTTWLLREFIAANDCDVRICLHVHEWLAGVAVIATRLQQLDVATVFTTHATLLGRYLCASGDIDFYNGLQHVHIDKEAGNRQIYHRYCIERAAASLAHVFTTVSDTTAYEAKYLLKREADVVTPNGIQPQKHVALHEFQNKHAQYKQKICDFIRGHFYGHLDWDLDETLFFFIAGRYEYRNKGGDMFIESLARLNHWLKSCGSTKTVVAFIIFPTPHNSFNVESMRGHTVLHALKETVEELRERIGKRIFQSCASGKVPEAASLISVEEEIKLKRCVFSANVKIVAFYHSSFFAQERHGLPPICTHNVCADNTDEVLTKLRQCRLFNHKDDRVKVVFHPEFLSVSNPLWNMDYEEFVRGCHLGVFPSYYEPWGYTPAECTVLGVPSVTTNLSGFGMFMEQKIIAPEQYGIYIVDRRYRAAEESQIQLTQFLFDFTKLSRRQRIILRNRTERLSEILEWKTLRYYYVKAHQLALSRAYTDYSPAEPDIMEQGRLSKPTSEPPSPSHSMSATPIPSDDDAEEHDSDQEREELGYFSHDQSPCSNHSPRTASPVSSTSNA